MRKLEEDQKESIKALIADRLFADIEDISDDTHLKNDLGADSLDNVEVLMDLEKSFNINIPDADFEEVETVADVYKIVERYY